MEKCVKSEREMPPVWTGDPQNNETEFRTVSHQGRRYGIRLEPVFWKVLELAAKHRRDKLATYLGNILSGTADKQNRTSILRVHAVSWLSRRLLDSATQGIGQKSIDAISTAVFQPAFSIGRDQKFTGYNAAFYEMLRVLCDETGTELSSNLSVAFKREVDEMRAALSASRDKYIEDKIIIKLSAKSIEKDVRVVALESATGQHAGFYVIVC